MGAQYKIGLIDTHAGGDVSRIVINGIKDLPGNSVREQVEYLQSHADGLRKTLLSEPYGIPEMSIDLVVPTLNKQAVAGYIIMEVMGYPIYSGSNTMCTATAVIETGLAPKVEGVSTFKLEAPAGLVDIEAYVKNGVVESITCEGLPSYIHAYMGKIQVDGLGEVTYSIAYSGGFYALVNASDFGFNLTIDEEQVLNETAYKIIDAIRSEQNFEHYALGDVGPISFLHFMGKVEQKEPYFYTSRSTTYVHPGVVCRSTTGTGTSARLAFLNYEDKLEAGDKLETVSLRETKFIGTFDAVEKIHGYDVVKNRTTGKSYLIANSEIIVNLDDSMTDCRELSILFE